MNELEKRAQHHKKFQKGCLFPFGNAQSYSEDLADPDWNEDQEEWDTEHTWMLIKTDKWYDPEGLGIESAGQVICKGTEKECREKFSEIVVKTKAKAQKEAERARKYSHAPFVKIDKLDATSLVVYYPHAQAKDVYTLHMCDDKRVDEGVNISLRESRNYRKTITERWADDALEELSKKPKEEWTEADWDTYNYCKNANAERDYYDSLDESKKKKVKGAYLNKDAGNVEHNVAMFNHMNSPADSPCTNPCGPMGESIRTEWVNFYHNGKKLSGYTAREEAEGEREDTINLLAHENNCDPSEIEVKIELNESRSVKDTRDIGNRDEAINDSSDLTQYIEARLIDITSGFTASQAKGSIRVPEGVSKDEMHDAIYNILGKYYPLFHHRNYRVGKNMSVVIEGRPLETPLEVAPAIQKRSSTTSRSTKKVKKQRVIPYKYYDDNIDGWVESEIIMTPSMDEAGGYDVSWGDNDDYEWCATVREAKALVAHRYDEISFESSSIKEDFAKTKDYEYFTVSVPSPSGRGNCRFGIHEHNNGHCSISGIHPYDDGDYHWATSKDGVTFNIYVGSPGKIVKKFVSESDNYEDICSEIAKLDQDVKSVMIHW